jgi:hypothetical protein
MKSPKGGVAVIARSPARRRTAVQGAALIAPRTSPIARVP